MTEWRSSPWSFIIKCDKAGSDINSVNQRSVLTLPKTDVKKTGLVYSAIQQGSLPSWHAAFLLQQKSRQLEERGECFDRL